jgi:hypothetical protein
MPTTTRRTQVQQFLATMLLGVVMAAVIYLLADPEVAWIGFALAAVYGHTGQRRSCSARILGGWRR